MKKLSAVERPRLVERSRSRAFASNGALTRAFEPENFKVLESNWSAGIGSERENMNLELYSSVVCAVKYDLNIAEKRRSDGDIPDALVVSSEAAKPPILL